MVQIELKNMTLPRKLEMNSIKNALQPVLILLFSKFSDKHETDKLINGKIIIKLDLHF